MPTSPPTRIAMWSGPRNISTAMMRSWDARPDTVVCDEPLYARYLKLTGADHPARDEIIANCQTDLDALIATLTGPIPGATGGLPTSGSSDDAPNPSNRPETTATHTIFYQKHMAHHLLENDDLDWILQLTNCLLIRNPAEMITSYIKVIEDPTPHTLALPQQQRLFHRITNHTGSPPPIIDARDALENPRAMLTRLCDALHVPFTDRMLSWPPGPRPTDGPWARYWYANVERSTTFTPYKPKNEPVPDHLQSTLAACNEIYHQLHAQRLT